MRTGKQFFVALIVILLAAGLGHAATPGIMVADASNHRIVGMDNMAGAGWATFGTRGSEVNQFTWPRAVFVDAAGRIYVVDQDNHRIVRMDDMTGAGWVTFGAVGTGDNQFRSPRAIFVDAAGRIYVADLGNHRIVRIDDMTGAGWATFGTGVLGLTSLRGHATFLSMLRATSTW